MIRSLVAVSLVGMMTLPAVARDKIRESLKDAADDVKSFRNAPDTPVKPLVLPSSPDRKSQEWVFLVMGGYGGKRSIAPLQEPTDLATCQMTRDIVQKDASKNGINIVMISPCLPRANICSPEARESYAKSGVTSFVNMCR